MIVVPSSEPAAAESSSLATEHPGAGILIIYTGGTIGSLPRDRRDPLSPLEPAPIEEVLTGIRTYRPADKTLAISRSRVRIDTRSFDPPLDSSNILPEHWVRIARIIHDNLGRYEGFVVLHGTDTMAYTASALAFMLENLPKPVIVTGSQRPIGEPRSDAEQNLITAVEIAAARGLGGVAVPEVCVFFRDELLRGCRSTKQSASSYDAFESPNLKPLGLAGDRIVIDRSIVRPLPAGPPLLHTAIEPHVASLDIFPGIQPALLREMLGPMRLRGIVLKTYGSGNAPSSPELLAALAAAVDHGVLVVAVTQCPQGEVKLGRYAVSAGLVAAGVVSGLDMTPEAALTKMFVVLGEEPDPAIAADMMQLNLRGEQRLSIFKLHFPPGGFSSPAPPGSVQSLRALRPMAGYDRFLPARAEAATLTMTGLRIPGANEGRIRFHAFLNATETGQRSPAAGNPHYLGEAVKPWRAADGDEVLFLPVARAAMPLLSATENTLTLVNETGAPFAWTRLHIACFADC